MLRPLAGGNHHVLFHEHGSAFAISAHSRALAAANTSTTCTVPASKWELAECTTPAGSAIARRAVPGSAAQSVRSTPAPQPHMFLVHRAVPAVTLWKLQAAVSRRLAGRRDTANAAGVVLDGAGGQPSGDGGHGA